MRVMQVAIRPTEASLAAGRPALTPELLAASGARYSRNNEGLQAILTKIDPEHPDRSVDSIFRMIDYGHQSIADMAPVSLFIDGISLWLAYYVWTLCPTAGGQESSTRYIRFSSEELIPAEELGIDAGASAEWRELMSACFQASESALDIWEKLAAERADIARIPRSLLDDPSEKARKQAARMKRNYGFDRARYFLPSASATNMMLVMSARACVDLCQHLLSHDLPEAVRLGEAITAEIELCTPRLLKHATAKTSIRNGMAQEFENLRKRAMRQESVCLDSEAERFDAEPEPHLQVMAPAEVEPGMMAADLEFHDNRYAWFGENLCRTAVRFAWDAVALAEIRDLNRHRTGHKFCPLIPRGFYCALDQFPLSNSNPFPNQSKIVENEAKSLQNQNEQNQKAWSRLRALSEVGRRASATALSRLRSGDPGYVYWTVLGTQFPFEHVTTADKFIYEAELRTGVGAHFRYARHLHDMLLYWYEKFPETRGLILEGSAEPE